MWWCIFGFWRRRRVENESYRRRRRWIREESFVSVSFSVRKPQFLCDFFYVSSYELTSTSPPPSSTVSNVDDVVAVVVVVVVVISAVESNWCFAFCRGGFDGCSRGIHSSFDDDAWDDDVVLDVVGRGIWVEAVFSAEIATWNSFSMVCLKFSNMNRKKSARRRNNREIKKQKLQLIIKIADSINMIHVHFFSIFLKN